MIYVYMDFDGVINAVTYSFPRDRTGWNGGWQRKAIAGYRIVWSEELVAELRKLDERPDVTIKWLTTWASDAPRLLAPELGIGHDWPVLGRETEPHEFEDFKVWWKKSVLQLELDNLGAGDKVVWIDDDLLYENTALEIFKEFPGEFIAVCPKTALGLTRPELEDILKFIDKEEGL